MTKIYLKPSQLGQAEQAWGTNASAGITGAISNINTIGGKVAKSVVADIIVSDLGSGVTGTTAVATIEFRGADNYSLPGAAVIVKDLTTGSGATGITVTAADVIGNNVKRVEIIPQGITGSPAHVFAHAAGVTGSPTVAVIGC